MKIHPLANLFPDMTESQFATFAADIKANGVREPITIYEDAILDGKHRFKACTKAKVKPKYEQYTGDDPLGFVISKNLARRHLSVAERAIIGAEITNGAKQGPKSKLSPANISVPDAAKTLNVSRVSIDRARKILEAGSAKLIAEVRAGEVSLEVGAEIAKLPKGKQSDPRKRKLVTKKKYKRDPNYEAPLNSFAWSNANRTLRSKWIGDVGVRSIWEAMSDEQRDELYKVAEASDTAELGISPTGERTN